MMIMLLILGLFNIIYLAVSNKGIIFALEQLEDEKMISYSEEIRWLKNLQDRFDE